MSKNHDIAFLDDQNRKYLGEEANGTPFARQGLHEEQNVR
jgi:hypothetical protein